MRRASLLASLSVLLLPLLAAAKPTSPLELARKNGEVQIRNLVEPVLSKYCQDECRLMGVNIDVDTKVADELAPGFEDAPSTANELEPTGGRIRLLISDKVGPVSRGKLLELIQQFLDTLEFPIRVETQISHFPQPIGSEGKAAELREKIARQFKQTLEELFHQFCPEQCLLADFDIDTEVVNGEEAQFGSIGEFVQDGSVAVRIRDISATILIDQQLAPEERAAILEAARLKTNFFRNVDISSRSIRFPTPSERLRRAVSGTPAPALDANGQPVAQSTQVRKDETATDAKTSSTNSSTSTTSQKESNTQSNTQNLSTTNQTAETNSKQERFERFEKIERVENGDAIQKELEKFKFYGLVFCCSVLSLLVFIAMATLRPRSASGGGIHRIIQSWANDPITAPAPSLGGAPEPAAPSERMNAMQRKYEIQRLIDELSGVFAEQPKVAKEVFSRILVEEGVETTAAYVHIFGESIVVDMLRDPSLQSDMAELMEFYAKTPIELKDDEILDLLRRLHNRTVAGKLQVLGNRSSSLFDYLADMDGHQILELMRNESLTVKSIVLTQCDPQKRATIYSNLDDDTRMRLLTELSRIDYLPRDYIFNVATALKRKRRENPKLNTEALPGSEVLVTLLERTGPGMQRAVLKQLETNNPDSARTVKAKLVSIDTLRYLRDGQLLEVVLNLKHEELLQLLKGAPPEVRQAIFAKSPKELSAELEEELGAFAPISREVYQSVERKVINRLKLMANEGLINLVETNERMFADLGIGQGPSGFVETAPPSRTTAEDSGSVRKAAGW